MTREIKGENGGEVFIIIANKCYPNGGDSAALKRIKSGSFGAI